MRFIDLSHIIANGVTTYKGLPAPIICDYLSREASKAVYGAGTTFQIGKIEMVSNTGTYVDAPFHRYEDGMDVADLPLERLANLETVAVRPRLEDGRAVDAAAFERVDVRGKAVLVETGWSRHWNTEAYFEGFPLLADRGAALVGIDSHNIDNTADGARPVHTVLLGAGIPIAEHLTNLTALGRVESRFFAVPVKVRGMGTFPVRAFAIA
jgi:arylformamidase